MFLIQEVASIRYSKCSVRKNFNPETKTWTGWPIWLNWAPHKEKWKIEERKLFTMSMSLCFLSSPVPLCVFPFLRDTWRKIQFPNCILGLIHLTTELWGLISAFWFNWLARLQLLALYFNSIKQFEGFRLFAVIWTELSKHRLF